MPDPRLEAASAWRLRREQGLSAAEAARFDLWMADSANVAAYRQVEDAWGAFDRPDSPDLAALRARTRGRLSRRRMLNGVVRVAATVAVAAGGLEIYASQSADAYENAGPSPKVVLLSDGSRLTLDAETRVRVRYRADGRRFELQRGQANFQVAHDPQRPFQVRIGKTTVTALGTTFNIDRWGGAATITLLEGGVQVAAAPAWFGAPSNLARLSPGQQVTVEDGRSSAVASVEAEMVSAWREGRLVFSDASLGQAIASVNRYGGPAVKLAKPGLGGLRISGMFRAGDTAAFARSVAKLHGLRAETGPDGITLQARE